MNNPSNNKPWKTKYKTENTDCFYILEKGINILQIVSE